VENFVYYITKYLCFNLFLTVIKTYEYVRSEWMGVSESVNNTSASLEYDCIWWMFLQTENFFFYNLVQHYFRYLSGLTTTKFGMAALSECILFLFPNSRQTHCGDANDPWRTTAVVMFSCRIWYYNNEQNNLGIFVVLLKTSISKFGAQKYFADNNSEKVIRNTYTYRRNWNWISSKW
jgi:hypothetical protein